MRFVSKAVELMDAGTLNQIAPVKIVDDFSGGAVHSQ